MNSLRTPRRPLRPIQEGGFALCGTWSVQICSEKHQKFLFLAKSDGWSSAYEFARGYVRASWDYKAKLGVSLEGNGVIWIVGPDGNGYCALQGAGS